MRATRGLAAWKRMGAAALLFVGGSLGGAGTARADTPIGLQFTWSGKVDFFATGAPMATDGADADTNVDTLVQPATVTVPAGNLPADAELIQALLYWAGSIPNADCVPLGKFDDEVELTPPGASAPSPVKADVCYCSDAQASAYDVQVCRADVTALVGAGGGDIAGAYAVDKFAAQISNGATDSASFSIVLVFRSPSLPPRDIGLYDGVETLSSQVNPTATVTLGGLQVDAPPNGSLTWYTLEGDMGGGSPGVEEVVVKGYPGGASLTLSDADNPAQNPMNRTINTTLPAQTGTIGVDIDQFDISGALTAGDTAVEMLYSANTDKWWIAYNIVGIKVFEPVFATGSKKTGALHVDANGNGVLSPGDTVRYSIQMANTGSSEGVVDVIDLIPLEAASWSLVSLGGGTDASTATTLAVMDAPVLLGGSASIVFDMVVADVPDGTALENTAEFDATPEGDAGSLEALPMIVRRDGDADAVFDSDDNCPLAPNAGQEDADGDGAGDACDACALDADDDADGDGVCGDVDNCAGLMNAGQEDQDQDGLGDACDDCAVGDDDADGACDSADNCAGAPNAGQEDADQDGLGDACDACVLDPKNDADNDGVCGDVDNCPESVNAGQQDQDADGAGDACDECAVGDDDADGVCDVADNCDGAANAGQEDKDSDGLGDACDPCPMDMADDSDGDGVCDGEDNCDQVKNADQGDTDGDGQGNACEKASIPAPPATPGGSYEEAGCGCRAAGADGELPGGALAACLMAVGCALRRARRDRAQRLASSSESMCVDSESSRTPG